MKRIVAWQGPGRYLLDLGEVDGRPLGQIIDQHQGRLYAPQNRESILARGYWEEWSGTAKEEAAILASVEPAARLLPGEIPISGHGISNYSAEMMSQDEADALLAEDEAWAAEERAATERANAQASHDD